MKEVIYFRLINTLLIYSPKSSNRLNYILKTLIAEGLGLVFEVTNDEEEFRSYPHAKLNYSDLSFEQAVCIKPHSILYDHGIRDYHLQVSAHPRFEKVFFKNGQGEIPFDLLGAAFWLLSRYEEYLPYKPDKENRFHYKSSLAYQYEFIHYPLVNLWLQELKQIFHEKFPDLIFSEKNYQFISTIDVDNVYKHKHKGFVRTMAGFISDRRLAKMKERLRIILGLEPDPFDCYDFLISAHKERQIKAIFFFLLGDYGPNDKNHSSSDLRFQALIKHIADYSQVGVHPSFGSYNNLRQLKIETSRLSNITHKFITKSRQHFSMLKFPTTYKDLLQAGLFADYSMGYTNHNGFRASYCFPYKWYSLDIESTSSLTIHPFCISENTLLTDSSRTNKTLMQLANPIVNEVKRYGGELISIFHNNNFDDSMKVFYADFLDLASHR